MLSIAASFVAAKRSRHNFLVFVEFRSILVFTGDVFDVGYVPFERSPEAANSRGAAAGASM